MTSTAVSGRRRAWRGVAAMVTTAMVFAAAPTPLASAAGGPNLAAGKATAASSVNAGFVSGNVADGNQATYWESAAIGGGQWVQADLGSATSIDQVVLKLPTGWGARTQTLSVQGSNDGVAFATIVGSSAQSFNGSSNTVTLNFTAFTTKIVRVNITANSGWTAAQLSELEVYGAGVSATNLAAGKAMSESGHAQDYVAARANDGNATGTSYWEGPANSYPQWLRVDLGSSVPVNRVVVKVPTGWGARTQTFAIQGSTDGTTWNDLSASAVRAFDPASGNTVSVTFTQATLRYVRLNFTANTGSTGGQVAEFEVYGPTTGDTVAPTAPTNLNGSTSGTTVNLTWSASTDTGGSGLKGYNIYTGGVLRTTVGLATSYADTNQPATSTIAYTIKAIDNAGNESAVSNTFTRQGQTTDTTPPSVPANLTGSTSGTTVTLNWSASTDAGGSGLAGYIVYADGVEIARPTGTTHAVSNVPTTATVNYTVRARDSAGNNSGVSNTWTHLGQSGPCSTPTNQATGKTATSSSDTFTFVAANTIDGNRATYWEGALPATLTVAMGSNVTVSSVVVQLNPDPAWGTRTQTFSVQGREQSSSTYTTLVVSATYTFTAGTNSVSIPVPNSNVTDLRLAFTANSGATGAQVAELQVLGCPAPNPDLTVTAVSASPANPIETDSITLSATVRNAGTAASAATNVRFFLGTTSVGSAPVGALAAGASVTVSTTIGTRPAGTYALSAKADDPSVVVEQSETNNTGTGGNLTVGAVQSADLVVTSSTSPGTPVAGRPVTFSATITNQGNVASSSAAHGLTTVVKNATGTTVATLTGSYTGAIAPGASVTVALSPTYTPSNGRYTTTTTVAADSAELSVKQGNNTATGGFYVGRGANMPFDILQAENAVVGGGANILGSADGRNRTVGDIAGEASGRRAALLDATGEFVEFTTTASTNTMVTRFVIPDNAAGTGIDSTINVYVNGTFHKALPLTSRFSWVYGEASPQNTPGAGQRHLYDEANMFLDGTFPAGTRIKLQKDSANSAAYYGIDFISTEQVAPIANPNPSRYTTPVGFTQQDVQAALDRVRMDTTGNLLGVFLPTGNYSTSNKFQVYGKPVQVLGAGPWYSRFIVDPSQSNTDAGFRAEKTADGSRFSGFGFFGNYIIRIDGPGKVFDFKDTTNMKIDNIWTEHMICMFWGANTDFTDISNSRIRDTWADGINMTNGSTNNHLNNIETRTTGDDSFALFSAIDAGGGDVKDNIYENLTSMTTWRAAGLAVYGGFNNIFRNLLIEDTLTYSAVTISSLDFGYAMNGFGASPPTVVENASLVRSGGHFWGTQVFPAIWVFSASKVFQGIRVNNVDIIDPTYHGIMFQTNYSGGQPQNPVTDTIFTDVTISGARVVRDEFAGRNGTEPATRSGIGVWCNELPEPGQGPAVGQATFNNLVITNSDTEIRNVCPNFRIIRNP